MLQFKPYSVFVVYSKQSEDKELQRQHVWTSHNPHKQAPKQYGSDLFLSEIRADKPSAESATYEKTILESLTSINNTQVGLSLLTAFSSIENVWIFPKSTRDFEICGSCQLTWRWKVDPKAGGGIRIHFNPTDFVKNGVDDGLLHELVHAYRAMWYRRNDTFISRDFPDLEEFFAFQMQNMYRSAMRKELLWTYDPAGDPSHSYSYFDTKENIYNYISEMAPFISALRYLLKTEPLARVVASRTNQEYNPFRDLAAIEQAFMQLGAKLKFDGDWTIPDFETL